jgi:hypothetical protein
MGKRKEGEEKTGKKKGSEGMIKKKKEIRRKKRKRRRMQRRKMGKKKKDYAWCAKLPPQICVSQKGVATLFTSSVESVRRPKKNVGIAGKYLFLHLLTSI